MKNLKQVQAMKRRIKKSLHLKSKRPGDMIEKANKENNQNNSKLVDKSYAL
jgi:hypothetical protein